jgi:hypothetical protein
MRKFVLPAIVAACVGLAFLPSAARADGVIYAGTTGYYPYPTYVPPTYVPPAQYFVAPSYYVEPSYYWYGSTRPSYRYFPRYHDRNWREHHRR